MTPLLPLTGIYAIEVHMESYHFRFKKRQNELWYRDPKYPGQRIAHYVRKVSLTPGFYEILFTTATATEEQAAKVVAFDMYEDVGMLAANYMKDANTDCKSCVESLQSLLRANGLSDKKNYLLVRKQP